MLQGRAQRKRGLDFYMMGEQINGVPAASVDCRCGERRSKMLWHRLWWCFRYEQPHLGLSPLEREEQRLAGEHERTLLAGHTYIHTIDETHHIGWLLRGAGKLKKTISNQITKEPGFMKMDLDLPSLPCSSHALKRPAPRRRSWAECLVPRVFSLCPIGSLAPQPRLPAQRRGRPAVGVRGRNR